MSEIKNTAVELPTRAEIAESQRICQAASDPPWIHSIGNCEIFLDRELIEDEQRKLLIFIDGGVDIDDQATLDLAFCEHAREILPLRNAQMLDLLDRLEKLERKCELQGRLIEAMREPITATIALEIRHLRAELAALESGGSDAGN